MPFFAGTYFPARATHGMPAFDDVLERIAAAWREQPEAIRQQNAELQRVFDSLQPTVPRALDETPVNGATAALQQAFDPEHGGFGGAPKFPHPGPLRLALERSGVTDPEEAARARAIAEQSLGHMAAGGIRDHIGGGFARYAVDARWEIPHFEKMLCDNGLLLELYADAAAAFERDDFASVARGIADWALREMALPAGGFCASLDADSEGEEGRYYTWDRSEVRCVVGDADFALVARRLGFDRPPNFGDRWHPVGAADRATLSAEFGLAPADLDRRLEAALRALQAARSTRAAPARDDKVLTAWNALMARGLAVAGHRLGVEQYVDAAQAALDFVRAGLWRSGRLFAVWRNGVHRQPAFVEDHAALLAALLASLEAHWRDADLVFARDVADALLEHFEDTANGGFFQTADDHEALPWRPKPDADESVPAANGVAALALDRLGHIVGEPRYVEAARGAVAAAMSRIESDPLGHATLVRALAAQFTPPEILVLRGAERTLGPWRRHAARFFRPGRLVLAIPNEAGGGLPGLPDAAPSGLAARPCRGTQCGLPQRDPAAVQRLISDEWGALP